MSDDISRREFMEAGTAAAAGIAAASIMPKMVWGRTVAETYYRYIDAPNFAYDFWLEGVDRAGRIGSPPGGPALHVGIVGGGVAGLCAAYELARAGWTVTVLEASDAPHGRTYSYKFPGQSTDIGELGAMRFPASEGALNHYLKKFRIIDLASAPVFPDPGVVPTLVAFRGDTQIWSKSESDYPAGFETVYNGWIALVTKGVTDTSGNPLLDSSVVQAALLTKDPADVGRDDLAQIKSSWQKYVQVFGNASFYNVVWEIFTGNIRQRSGFENAAIPGGTAWTLDDFARFGALGVGSGGFGPLYDIGFNYIYRLIPNGLETTQRFIAAGIQSLADQFVAQLNGMPNATILTNAAVRSIAGDPFLPPTGSFRVTTEDGQLHAFDRVIVATNIRSMEMSTDVSRFAWPNADPPVLAPETAEAVKTTHVISSSKLITRIPKFWSDGDGTTRNLLSDTMASQVYTLDYGSPDDTAVAIIAYTWEGDAVKQQALGVDHTLGAVDVQERGEAILEQIALIDGSYASNLAPLHGDWATNAVAIDWQSAPHQFGAFTLALPGQDEYISRMFFDYLKARDPGSDTGVYIAGDCTSFTGGWVEGALQSGLNAACAVVASTGGTVTSAPVGVLADSPLALQPLFDYFDAS